MGFGKRFSSHSVYKREESWDPEPRTIQENTSIPFLHRVRCNVYCKGWGWVRTFLSLPRGSLFFKISSGIPGDLFDKLKKVRDDHETRCKYLQSRLLLQG